MPHTASPPSNSNIENTHNKERTPYCTSHANVESLPCQRSVLPGSRPHSYKSLLMSASWKIFDNLVLFQMGSAYIMRFKEVQGGLQTESIQQISDWRADQQNEWNRLSTTLALMAAMQAGFLSLGKGVPDLAFSLWLGGASLSICGVFMVQYLSIKTFHITNMDMATILAPGKSRYVPPGLLAAIFSSPVVTLMWSTILFIIGMFDYIAKSGLASTLFRVIAVVPLGVGIFCMVTIMIIGEMIAGKVENKNAIV